MVSSVVPSRREGSRPCAQSLSHGHPRYGWPHDVSHKPYMSIGDMVKRVKSEFPALSLSKVRYFEEKGLLKPLRTKGGYRKFSDADVERLRYCLVQQRDHYFPISRIKEKLEELDRSDKKENTVPVARIVSHQGKIVAQPDKPLTMRELQDITGMDEDFAAELVSTGFIRADIAGLYPPTSLTVVTLLLHLSRYGLQPHHLAFMRLNIEQQADLVDQSVGRQHHARGIEKQRRITQATEMTTYLTRLHQEMLRLSLSMLE